MITLVVVNILVLISYGNCATIGYKDENNNPAIPRNQPLSETDLDDGTLTTTHFPDEPGLRKSNAISAVHPHDLLELQNESVELEPSIKEKRCKIPGDILGDIHESSANLLLARRDVQTDRLKKLCEACLENIRCKKYGKCELCKKYCESTTKPPKILDLKERNVDSDKPVHQGAIVGISSRNAFEDDSLETGLSEQEDRYYTIGSFGQGAIFNLLLKLLRISNTDEIERLVVLAKTKSDGSSTKPPHPVVIDTAHVFTVNEGKPREVDVELHKVDNKDNDNIPALTSKLNEQINNAIENKKKLEGDPHLTPEEIDNIIKQTVSKINEIHLPKQPEIVGSPSRNAGVEEIVKTTDNILGNKPPIQEEVTANIAEERINEEDKVGCSKEDSDEYEYRAAEQEKDIDASKMLRANFVTEKNSEIINHSVVGKQQTQDNTIAAGTDTVPSIVDNSEEIDDRELPSMANQYTNNAEKLRFNNNYDNVNQPLIDSEYQPQSMPPAAPNILPNNVRQQYVPQQIPQYSAPMPSLNPPNTNEAQQYTPIQMQPEEPINYIHVPHKERPAPVSDNHYGSIQRAYGHAQTPQVYNIEQMPGQEEAHVRYNEPMVPQDYSDANMESELDRYEEEDVSAGHDGGPIYVPNANIDNMYIQNRFLDNDEYVGNSKNKIDTARDESAINTSTKNAKDQITNSEPTITNTQDINQIYESQQTSEDKVDKIIGEPHDQSQTKADGDNDDKIIGNQLRNSESITPHKNDNSAEPKNTLDINKIVGDPQLRSNWFEREYNKLRNWVEENVGMAPPVSDVSDDIPKLQNTQNDLVHQVNNIIDGATSSAKNLNNKISKFVKTSLVKAANTEASNLPKDPLNVVEDDTKEHLVKLANLKEFTTRFTPEEQREIMDKTTDLNRDPVVGQTKTSNRNPYNKHPRLKSVYRNGQWVYEKTGPQKQPYSSAPIDNVVPPNTAPQSEYVGNQPQTIDVPNFIKEDAPTIPKNPERRPFIDPKLLDMKSIVKELKQVPEYIFEKADKAADILQPPQTSNKESALAGARSSAVASMASFESTSTLKSVSDATNFKAPELASRTLDIDTDNSKSSEESHSNEVTEKEVETETNIPLNETVACSDEESDEYLRQSINNNSSNKSIISQLKPDNIASRKMIDTENTEGTLKSVKDLPRSKIEEILNNLPTDKSTELQNTNESLLSEVEPHEVSNNDQSDLGENDGEVVGCSKEEDKDKYEMLHFQPLNNYGAYRSNNKKLELPKLHIPTLQELLHPEPKSSRHEQSPHGKHATENTADYIKDLNRKHQHGHKPSEKNLNEDNINDPLKPMLNANIAKKKEYHDEGASGNDNVPQFINERNFNVYPKNSPGIMQPSKIYPSNRNSNGPGFALNSGNFIPNDEIPNEDTISGPDYMHMNPPMSNPNFPVQQDQFSNMPQLNFPNWQHPSMNQRDMNDDMVGAQINPNIESRFKNFQDNTENYAHLGKFIPNNEQTLSVHSRDVSNQTRNMYFVGDGIKLPLNMKQHDDGSLHLSVDVKKLCTCKQCNGRFSHNVSAITSEDTPNNLNGDTVITAIENGNNFAHSGELIPESVENSFDDVPLLMAAPPILNVENQTLLSQPSFEGDNPEAAENLENVNYEGEGKDQDNRSPRTKNSLSSNHRFERQNDSGELVAVFNKNVNTNNKHSEEFDDIIPIEAYSKKHLFQNVNDRDDENGFSHSEEFHDLMNEDHSSGGNFVKQRVGLLTNVLSWMKNIALDESKNNHTKRLL